MHSVLGDDRCGNRTCTPNLGEVIASIRHSQELAAKEESDEAVARTAQSIRVFKGAGGEGGISALHFMHLLRIKSLVRQLPHFQLFTLAFEIPHQPHIQAQNALYGRKSSMK